MRERMEQMEGELGIQSEPGAGTRIEASLPMEKVK
jgi:signal transduction histidine kinase